VNPHTETVNRLGLAAAVVVLGAAACARTDTGVAVPAEQGATSSSQATSSSPSTTTPTSESASATEIPESSQPGVLETTKHPIAPNAVVCPSPGSGQTAVASTGDPGAPQVTIALPPGWTSQPGSGNVGVQLSGPGGMVGDVTITAVSLDAAASFTHYADDVMAKYPISSLSALPDELCGYSGQKLMGNWADSPDKSIQYKDRIVHVWTNDKDYLVAVHVQAPSGAVGFDEAASVLIGDFGVSIP